MTKIEIMKQIESLEKQIADLKEEVNFYSGDVGFEDDDIFLLSYDEYKRYKDVIPQSDIAYLLRNDSEVNGTPYVGKDGEIHYAYSSSGYLFGILPVIKLSEYYNDPIGTIVTAYNFPWVCIDSEKHLYIAEVPIAIKEFTYSLNVNYKDSDIRKFLKEWSQSR